MISFIQPKSLPWNGVDVPLNFPYLSTYLQGPPHYNRYDEFFFFFPRMELGKRAKIFAPFDALDGYSDAVRSKDEEYVERIDLSEQQERELSHKLNILHNLTYTGRLARLNRVIVTVTYFVSCEDENSFSFGLLGLYKKVTGVCWKVDAVGQMITVGPESISLSEIISIEADEVFAEEWEMLVP